jgi:hypothetical protein
MAIKAAGPPWPLMAITPAVAPPPLSSPYKTDPEPLQLPLCTLPCSHTLSPPPRAPPLVKPGRRAIAGHPALLVAGEHLIGLLASSLASRSAHERIPCPGPLISCRTEPPEAHRRRSSTSLDLRRCLFSFAVCYTKDSREGEQLNHPSLSCLDLPSP